MAYQKKLINGRNKPNLILITYLHVLQSGPAAFVHPADNVPWSKKKERKSGKETESLSALGKKTPARKIVNEKANSQIGFIFRCDCGNNYHCHHPLGNFSWIIPLIIVIKLLFLYVELVNTNVTKKIIEKEL